MTTGTWTGPVPLLFSACTAVLTFYICFVLYRDRNKFYHLWNRLAMVAYFTSFACAIARCALEIFDWSKGHAPLSNDMCAVSYGLNQFLSSSLEILYILFMLICCSIFNEPDTRKAIEWGVVVCVIISYGYACAGTAIPLFAKEPLERHSHAWCWLSHESHTMRWVFSYFPGIVSDVVALYFVGWVLCVETRVRKFRILTFGLLQLACCIIWTSFSLYAQYNHGNDNGSVFHAFSVWISLHDSVRAVAFIIGERLYPTEYLACCSPQAASGGVVDHSTKSMTNRSELERQQEQQTDDDQQQQQHDYGATSSSQDHHHRGGDTNATTATAGGGTGRTFVQNALTRGSENTDLLTGVDVRDDDFPHRAAEDEEQLALGDDTLTYFVRVLQRRSDDSGSGFLDADIDRYSDAAGARPASIRHSNASTSSRYGGNTPTTRTPAMLYRPEKSQSNSVRDASFIATAGRDFLGANSRPDLIGNPSGVSNE